LNRLADSLHDLRALDTLAARATALARRDARAKLLATLAFVVTVLSFDRYCVAALLPMALFPTVLAVRAELPARTLWRTLWLASPFALMVGLANPLLDRAPMVALAGVELSAGWVSFVSIVLRVALTVSAAVVLIGSTGMHALCGALARLGVPRVFTVQLLFLHRYLFVLAGEAQRSSTALQLRAVSGRGVGLALHASLLGQLLLRAFERARRVHQAMLARGFDGELRLAHSQRWRYGDSIFLAGWCAYFIVVRYLDLPQALGTFLMGLGT
jgi:cobalt/nickel transport system permease protein